MTSAGAVPKPSDEVLIRLATIAAHAEKLLAPEKPLNKARVGIQTLKNDRRRTAEAVMVMLTDPEVRKYVAELERLGLLPTKS